MKKYRILSTALAALLLLSGCQNQPESTTAPAEIETQPPTTTEDVQPIVPPSVNLETLYSVSMPVTTENGTAEDGTAYFSYSYQSMQLSVPDRDVADKIILDFLSRVDSTRAEAERIHDLAQSAYNTGSSAFRPYAYQVQYNPVRIDQGVLSLYGQVVSVSDTGHASTDNISANYDMVTGDVLTLGSILYRADLKEKLAELVIKDLESREDIALYEDYQDTVRSRFQRDESADEDFYFSSRGLCFYFSPYELAPYMYGTVEVEIPYSQLTGLIGDDFFPNERILSSGELHATAFAQAELSNYETFTEIVLGSNGSMVLITADSTVQDIKIQQLIWEQEESSYTQENTVYAANVLTESNAILLEADLQVTQTPFRITYLQNGYICECFLYQDLETGEFVLTPGVCLNAIVDQ